MEKALCCIAGSNLADLRIVNTGDIGHSNFLKQLLLQYRAKRQKEYEFLILGRNQSLGGPFLLTFKSCGKGGAIVHHLGL
jgi:hypothetical protein